MKRGWFLRLAVACLMLSACASGHREAFRADVPAVRDLAGLELQLRAAVAASPAASLMEAGVVRYEGFEAPMWRIRIAGSAEGRRVLVLGGIHGNEPAGSAWVVELAQELASEPQPDSFDLLPVLNPWGWSHDRRFNREGRDINRDFASFAAQEARILRDLVRAQRYDLIIDHHEDPDAAGFYLYQYARRDTSAARGLIAAARRLGYPIEEQVRMVILRTRDGLIRAPRWGLWYMRLSRQLSATNYLRLENSRRVYTVETPMHLPLPDRLALHRLAFEYLLQEP